MKYALILILVLIPLGSALSISPAAKDVFITEPYTYTIAITHEHQQNTTITIESIHDLPEQILIPPNTTYFLPVTLQPTAQQTSIIFEEQFSQEGMVTAGAALRHVITTQTPTPGTQANIYTTTSALIPNQPVLITTHIRNTGTQEITRAQATHTIYDTQQRELISKTTQSEQVAVGQRQQLISTWIPPNPGVYTLQARTTYNNHTHTEQITVEVGLLQITTKDPIISVLGEDAIQIQLPIINEWNEDIRVHAELTLMQHEQVTHTTLTPTETISPRTEQPLIATFVRVPEGVYSLTADIHYANKVLTVTHPITIRYSPQRLIWLERGALILLIITLVYEYRRRKTMKRDG